MMAWLASQGFENAFLDKDKTTGIPPGGDWERTLYREVEQSQAVVIIQTPDWLASKWCFAEFTQARALGKAIFPAIEAPTGDTLISPDIQTLNLMSDREGGLERLKRELVRIALDAQGGFAWDANRPPFPGLLAFQEEDAAIYFGRDDDIRRLIERLDARRAQGGAKLVALLGSSGSGKSSLLRAGVIPRLKRAGRNWIVVPAMRPRIHPVDELARALATAFSPPLDWAKLRGDLAGADPVRALDAFAGDLRVKAGAADAQILIPIDQAEELFGVADPDEARRFLDILSRALSENLPFMAVMTMRSDFLAQLQSATALTARFEEFSLGPMPLARVPQIIEGPARVAGLGVEDAFVQQAAGDAETEDALPLLAFALRELLDRSPNKSLTLAGYAALGDGKAGLTPLENAVRQAADQVLADAKPADNELAALREAFVPAMVRVNDQGEYVRRPARLDELPAKSQSLLERLAKARLLIVRQDGDARVVEVAHEALLRKWPLLRSWLDSAREFLIGKQQLEQELRDWDQASEADKAGALLTGLRFNRARGWLIDHPNQLSMQERAFIQASIDRDEAEKRSQERRRKNFTRGAFAVAAVLALFLAGAVVEWLAARDSAQQARATRDLATANEESARKSEQRAIAAQKTATANEARALTALSQAASLHGHYTDAVKLALAAWPRTAADERPELSRTIDALGEALDGPLEVSQPIRHKNVVYSATFSPDGARLLTASLDNTAQVWDAATGAPIGAALRLEGAVYDAAFSPDGKRVVTASSDKTARLWDATTGLPIGRPMRHDGYVFSAVFSPDGARVATASQDKSARVWDAATGAPIGKPMQHEDVVRRASFSPDGKLVVTASWDKTARLWDATTGAPIGKPLSHNGAVNSAAFSPDSQRVVTASVDKSAQVWDAATGAPIGRALQHEEPVNSAAFSPDGARVLTASDDKTARLWDAASGAPIGRPLQHDNQVNSAEFRPDGARVVTASWDNSARVWDAATGAPIAKALRDDDPVKITSFSSDGARIVAVSNDTAWVWDAATGKTIGKPLSHSGAVNSAEFSLDGARVVTASSDNSARVWDATTGEAIVQSLPHKGPVNSAAFSRDGKRVVTASDDNTARVWDAATGAPIGNALRHAGPVHGAEFSPDGARVVTASADKTARLWDAATGAPIGAPLLHVHPVYFASFSPDGGRVVTASGGRAATASGSHYRSSWMARVWDPASAKPIGRPMDKQSGVVVRINGVSFSPDGARVATASSVSAQVWDATTGAPIGRPLQQGERINSVKFSVDGARVVTASDDKTARVWDAATGTQIGQPMQHEGSVRSASFSPDGTRVATASDDKTARIWNAPPLAPNIIATACKMLGSNEDTTGLFTRYGIDVKDPICTGNEPAPDPSRMIDR
jgi:WD40 repeat protein